MVLAAGKGTRLFPLIGEIPKPMAPVVGKPIIQHILELLAQTDVGEVHVNVHHLPGGRRSEELWADDRRTRLHPTVSLQGRMVVGRDVVIGRGSPWSGTPW